MIATTKVIIAVLIVKTMAKVSENAKAVAMDVIDHLKKGKKVILGEILRKHGYSDLVSRSPHIVTDTLGYKMVMNDFIKQMMHHRDKVLKEMEVTDLSTVDYDKLSQSLTRLNHDIDLLGSSDERSELEIQLSEDKYAIILRRETSRVKSGGTE